MKFEDVPGWFMPIDQAAFAWILAHQAETGPAGALVELGVYFGKSAIAIDSHRRDDEVLTVCDLFEDIARSGAADPGEARFFAAQGQSQAEFERHFLAFRRELPRIVRAPSTQITRHVAPATARFVHLDAGHTQDLVRADLASARVMLRPGGVVAVEAYRKPSDLGVAAALWEAILTGGLRPIANTDFKLYATWGDPAPMQAEIRRRAVAAGWCHVAATSQVGGAPVLYLGRKG